MTHKTNRRNKLEIFHDVLCAIQNEATSGEIKPTRIQFLCNTSYDKLMKYLAELEQKKMIINNPLSLTEKGQQFVREYSVIKEFIQKLGLEYIENTDESD